MIEEFDHGHIVVNMIKLMLTNLDDRFKSWCARYKYDSIEYCVHKLSLMGGQKYGK